jgi:hypothetical protein
VERLGACLKLHDALPCAPATRHDTNADADTVSPKWVQKQKEADEKEERKERNGRNARNASIPGDCETSVAHFEKKGTCAAQCHADRISRRQVSRGQTSVDLCRLLPLHGQHVCNRSCAERFTRDLRSLRMRKNLVCAVRSVCVPGPMPKETLRFGCFSIESAIQPDHNIKPDTKNHTPTRTPMMSMLMSTSAECLRLVHSSGSSKQQQRGRPQQQRSIECVACGKHFWYLAPTRRSFCAAPGRACGKACHHTRRSLMTTRHDNKCHTRAAAAIRCSRGTARTAPARRRQLS